MEVEELKAVRELVDQCTRIAMLIPIEHARELVNESNHMGTILPFVDPTEYMKQQDNIRIRDRQFRVFLDFRIELEKIKDAIPSR